MIPQHARWLFVKLSHEYACCAIPFKIHQGDTPGPSESETHSDGVDGMMFYRALAPVAEQLDLRLSLSLTYAAENASHKKRNQFALRCLIISASFQLNLPFLRAPPAPLLKEILSGAKRVTFYGFLMAMAKSEELNKHVGE